jgi:hypothetical protein
MNDWMLLFLRWSPPSVQIVRKPKRRPHIRSFFSLLILFNTTAMAQSAAPPQVPHPLDVKPGLWEFVKVVTVLMHQTIPPEMFANFPKDQRDKIIDDIRAKENAAHPNTQKGNLCMPKQEQALTGLMVVPASDCAKTVTSSGNGSQTHIICPAKAPANALAANAAATATVVQDSHFERIDAENFKGTITANQSAPSLKMMLPSPSRPISLATPADLHRYRLDRPYPFRSRLRVSAIATRFTSRIRLTNP